MTKNEKKDWSDLDNFHTTALENIESLKSLENSLDDIKDVLGIKLLDSVMFMLFSRISTNDASPWLHQLCEYINLSTMLWRVIDAKGNLMQQMLEIKLALKKPEKL